MLRYYYDSSKLGQLIVLHVHKYVCFEPISSLIKTTDIFMIDGALIFTVVLCCVCCGFLKCFKVLLNCVSQINRIFELQLAALVELRT